MVKYTFSSEPKPVKINNNKYRFFFNVEPHIESHIDEDTQEVINETIWEAEAVDVDELRYDLIVDAIVRSRYSLSAELAILRQRDTDPEEFQKYYDWAETSKKIASIYKNNDVS